MGFKIKNSLTGEFEKLPILTLKGEKGETGGVEEYNKVDYMGNKYETLKQANDANVEYAVKTAIGEFNYLDYDGQHITATDTIEGRSKSAILKGHSLVNLAVNGLNKTYTNENSWTKLLYKIQPNKLYLLIIDVKENTLNKPFRFSGYTLGKDAKKLPESEIGIDRDVFNAGETGRKCFKVGYTEIPEGAGEMLIMFCNKSTDGTLTGSATYNIMFLEYQAGMENWDIPYFEGMASVKAPVLKSVGKNLFKLKTPDSTAGWGDASFALLEDGFSFQAKSGWNSVGFNVGYPNQQITVSATVLCSAISSNKLPNQKMGIGNVGYVIENRVNFVSGEEKQIKTTFNLDNTGTVWFYGSSDREGAEFKDEAVNWVIKDIQVELGSTSTTYEPHKSNILTTPEDVELRGIGDVKDELNLLTGEVTESIEEVVFDGSDDEKWTIQTDYVSEKYIMFGLELAANGRVVGVNPALSDKWMIGDISTEQSQSQICVFRHQGWITQLRVVIEKEKLANADVLAFRDYISKNNFKVIYAKESIVKTVDLSDNHVYSYKGTTHYDCSSAEGSLVPTLSVKVPTDVQATIAQQRETIQTLNSENERLNQIQEALKASMLDSQVQLMNLSWDTDFEVFTLRESIASKDFLLYSRTGSNIDKFSQAKFIIENDCPDLEKLNSQIEYYFSKDVFSQEQFEELTDLISIVKGENSCEY